MVIYVFRRAAEEKERMEEEDKLSEKLRVVVRVELQKKAYIAMFGEDTAASDIASVAPEKGVDGLLTVPEWMVLPDSWDDMNIVEQQRTIYRESRRRELELEAKKSIEKERKIMQQLYKKGKKDWKAAHRLLGESALC